MEPEERIVYAIGTFRVYAFVTGRDDSDTYDMHRLVHLATKVRLTGHGTIKDMNEKVASQLAGIFPHMIIVIRLYKGNTFLMLSGSSKIPKRWVAITDLICVWLLEDAFMNPELEAE